MKLNKEQAVWVRKLETALGGMPVGIELVFRNGQADVVPAGFEDRVLMAGDLHAVGDKITAESAVTLSLNPRMIPISEDI